MGHANLKFYYSSERGVSARELIDVLSHLPEDSVISSFVEDRSTSDGMRCGGFEVEHPLLPDGADLEGSFVREARIVSGILEVSNKFVGLMFNREESYEKAKERKEV